MNKKEQKNERNNVCSESNAADDCNFRNEVDLICGRYVVDAKSMLGVFSLPTFQCVELGVKEEEEQKCWKVFICFENKKMYSRSLSVLAFVR